MDRTGIFAGDDPFSIARTWLAEAGCGAIRRVDFEPGKGSLLLATRT
jgi:hypothetical protein